MMLVRKNNNLPNCKKQQQQPGQNYRCFPFVQNTLFALSILQISFIFMFFSSKTIFSYGEVC